MGRRRGSGCCHFEQCLKARWPGLGGDRGGCRCWWQKQWGSGAKPVLSQQGSDGRISTWDQGRTLLNHHLPLFFAFPSGHSFFVSVSRNGWRGENRYLHACLDLSPGVGWSPLHTSALFLDAKCQLPQSPPPTSLAFSPTVNPHIRALSDPGIPPASPQNRVQARKGFLATWILGPKEFCALEDFQGAL